MFHLPIFPTTNFFQLLNFFTGYMFPSTIYLKYIICNLFSFIKDPSWNMVYIICEYISYLPNCLTAPFFLMSNKIPVSKCLFFSSWIFILSLFQSTIGHHENVYKYLFRRSYLFSSMVSAVLNYGQWLHCFSYFITQGTMTERHTGAQELILWQTGVWEMDRTKIKHICSKDLLLATRSFHLEFPLHPNSAM